MISYYTGDGLRRSPDILTVDRLAQSDPANYRPEPGLRAAVNAALILGLPLLVTGEPGTGKSELGHAVAHELGLATPLVFSCKSTSVSRDILYGYDALARFQAAQSLPAGDPAADPRRFIRYQALGLAILRSHPYENVAAFFATRGEHAGPQRSLLIVDEIDKAPRDFPNDLLHEFDQLQFSVPELLDNPRTPVMSNPAYRPIVVITSNSERTLPDAFLRRCIYYHIDFPAAKLPEIVGLRLGEAWSGKPLMLDLLAAFTLLRSDGAGVEKKPGTAELLNWLQFFAANGADPSQRLSQNMEMLKQSLGIVLKHRRDLQEWLRRIEELPKAPR